jgi:hypothetical protein
MAYLFLPKGEGDQPASRVDFANFACLFVDPEDDAPVSSTQAPTSSRTMAALIWVPRLSSGVARLFKKAPPRWRTASAAAQS